MNTSVRLRVNCAAGLSGIKAGVGQWLLEEAWTGGGWNWGGGGVSNVLDAFEIGSTELVAVVEMLHMLAYTQQGGWVGLITYLTS